MNQRALRGKTVLAAAILLAMTGAAGASAFTAATRSGSAETVILRDGARYLELTYYDWGPDWSGVARDQEAEELDGASMAFSYAHVLDATGAPFTVTGGLAKTGADTLRFEAELTPQESSDLTMAQFSLRPASAFFGDDAVEAEHADGSASVRDVPLGIGRLGDDITELRLTDREGRVTTVAFDAPTAIALDQDMRMILAEDAFTEGASHALGFTLTLPGETAYYPGPSAAPRPPDWGQWYVFEGSSPIPEESEWSMAGWLDRPAGRHGRITRRDDQLVYNDEPIKLWGLNLSFANTAPDNALADRRADFYAAMGVNSVRFHKYADGAGWAGILSEDSAAEYDPEMLDRMDYFVAALRERGIFVKLSPVFITPLHRGDVETVPYRDEFGSGDRVKVGHGALYLSTEVQDLMIRQVTNLLTHTNPYTGLTYAEDPAVAFFELYNEDSALFFGTADRIENVPTLRERAAGMFAAWLRDKYGAEEAWTEAWGADAINGGLLPGGLRDEDWAAGRVYPFGNPWFYDPDNLETSQAPYRQRLLDTMAFLYELQNDVYARYEEAIRDAGYEGEIIYSNWRAGRAMSHYLNLHSDYRGGVIDRHNYFGGGGGNPFYFNNASMLAAPGSGLLSSGLHQVIDRPFMLSEWIHVYPNEWGAEGPAIIGAYGMGLQGWDVSYPFQNGDDGTFSAALGDSWDVTAPQFMGVFPTVARQVLRGDVAQSGVVHRRNVHPPSLLEGRVGFEDFTVQEGDVQSYSTDVFPAAALAAARGVNAFTSEFQETEPFGLDAYRDDGVVTASTGELAWRGSSDIRGGHFTMDTAGTQAIVGFAEGEPAGGAAAEITLESAFGVVYLTAQSPEGGLADDGKLLISAIARARNQGAIIVEDTLRYEDGDGPIVMEPVVAVFALQREGVPTVHILDHQGVKRGDTVPVEDDVFRIDTGRDQTPYYLVEY